MKNKLRKYLSLGLIGIMIFGFVYIGSQEYNQEKELTDQEKFSLEYPSIPKDNIYNYLTSNELSDMLENGTGILFIANPESSWSEPYAKYLNNVAKNNNVDKIDYYNIKHAKETRSRHYQNLVSKLEGSLITTDDSTNNLFTPMVIFIKNGIILGIDNTTAIMPNNATPNNYWTTDKIVEFENIIENNIDMM